MHSSLYYNNLHSVPTHSNYFNYVVKRYVVYEKVINMEVRLPWNNDPTKHICPRRRGFKSSLAHHWSENFLEIRHHFHTSILLSNWILTNQQTSILNLGSDAYFEYTSCYFKVVTLFTRNLFRVRLPYLLLISSLW
jgi:hypothetical protein